MGFMKKRRYRFTDSSIAIDTVIAFTMGGISLGVELAGIIASIVTKGNVHAFFAVLYLCAMILSLVGEFFAWLGLREQKGGMIGKRFSIVLNMVTFLIPIWIIIWGSLQQ